MLPRFSRVLHRIWVMLRRVLAPAVAVSLALFAVSSLAAKVDQAVLSSVNNGGTIRAIVELDVAVQRERGLTRAQLVSQRQQIASAQAQVRQALAAVGSPADKAFSTTPGMALRVDANILQALQNSPLVKRIYEDRLSTISLNESNEVIEANLMWAGVPPVTGAGYAVAVLDTGVDKNHGFFNDSNGAAVVAEYCASTSFNDGTEQVTSSFCPGGVATSSASGSGLNCDPTIAGCDHGTHVAGIVAGRPTSTSIGTLSGVAPGAGIIAAQVFSAVNTETICGPSNAPCALSFSSDQTLALEHVLSLNESEGGSLKVAAVNMSLGGGQYFSHCDGNDAAFLGVLNNLLDAGIAVAIATGNNGWDDSISSPACFSPAVSVGSTTKADGISFFSNVASGLVDLAAPGSSIASAVLSNNFAYKNGTSMATPHVAGAWALMRQALDQTEATSVATILDLLQNNGTVISQRESGADAGSSVKRINIAQSAQPTTTRNLLVDLTGIGNGSVSSSPAGINCPGTSCQQAFDIGTVVSLTATADVDNEFTAWGGDCAASGSQLTCQVTIDSTKTVTAEFFDPGAIIELQSGVPEGPISGSTGSYQEFYISVPQGTGRLEVALAVDTGDPDIFVSGTFPPSDSPVCTSENAPPDDELCTITDPSETGYYISVYGYEDFTGAVLTATNVTTFEVTPSADVNGSISPSFAQTVAEGETASFSLIPDSGFRVASVAGSCPSGTLSATTYTTGSIVAHCTVEASFEVDPTIPLAPTLNSITPGNGSLTVLFSPNSGGPTADSYAATCVPAQSLETTADVMMAVEDHSEWHRLDAFKTGGHRCGADEIQARHQLLRLTPPAASTADCSLYNTTITGEYDPLDSGAYVIPVYWHVISTSGGTGNVTDANINAQMAVLNEDYAAIFDTTVQFELVGITRTVNDGWFTDSPSDEAAYKSALGIDPSRYLNIYTNDAEGYLGYATFPAESAGDTLDGVVMNWAYVGGRNLPGASPYDLGRTLVHEVGHYLGLWHTFQGNGGQCANTFTSGDYIVDTWPHNSPDYGTSGTSVCGGVTDIENFMNYSDDIAMVEFTPEQSNRMICSLINYRPQLYSIESTGFTATGPSSPLTVTGLTNGTQYSCSVTAQNASGAESGASSSVVGIPRQPTLPGTPAISQSDVDDGEIYLYVSVDDGGTQVLEYEASCTDGVNTFYGYGSRSPVTVPGLTNGTAYQCNVRVRNALGWSGYSSFTAPITPEEVISSGLPIWMLYQAIQPPLNLSWQQRGSQLGGGNDLRIGQTVAINEDGNRLAYSSIWSDNERGFVVVWDVTDAENWNSMGGNIVGSNQGDRAGKVAMSADGTTVAVGAHHNDSAATDAGQIRVFRWDGSGWSQRGSAITGDSIDDYLGLARLSADGEHLVIGAVQGDTTQGQDSGFVRVYRWESNDWVQKGADIQGVSAFDQAGVVAIDNDGTRIAVGAPYDDDNGNDNGQVRVFEWDGSAWGQMGNAINGEGVSSATGDRAGNDIGLSADGSVLVMGAPLNDGGGVNSGSVRVFKWDSANSLWQHVIDIDGQPGDELGHSVGVSADGKTIVAGSFTYNNFQGYFSIYNVNLATGVAEQVFTDTGDASDSFSYDLQISADGTSVVVSGVQSQKEFGQRSGYIRQYSLQPAPEGP